MSLKLLNCNLLPSCHYFSFLLWNSSPFSIHVYCINYAKNNYAAVQPCLCEASLAATINGRKLANGFACFKNGCYEIIQRCFLYCWMKQIRKLKCNNSDKYYFLGQKSITFFRGYLFITYTKFSQKRTFLTILSLGNQKKYWSQMG